MCSSVLLAQSYGDTGIDFQKSRLLLSRAAPMRIGTPLSPCARSRGDNSSLGSTSDCAKLLCTFFDACLPVGHELLQDVLARVPTSILH